MKASAHLIMVEGMAQRLDTQDTAAVDHILSRTFSYDISTLANEGQKTRPAISVRSQALELMTSTRSV